MRWIQDPKTLELVPLPPTRGKAQDSPFIQEDYAPYKDPKTGEVISGRRAHRDTLARKGCHVLERGEKEEISGVADRRDREFDKRLRSYLTEMVNGPYYVPGE